jgi:hypothetical protein
MAHAPTLLRALAPQGAATLRQMPTAAALLGVGGRDRDVARSWIGGNDGVAARQGSRTAMREASVPQVKVDRLTINLRGAGGGRAAPADPLHVRGPRLLRVPAAGVHRALQLHRDRLSAIPIRGLCSSLRPHGRAFPRGWASDCPANEITGLFLHIAAAVVWIGPPPGLQPSSTG